MVKVEPEKTAEPLKERVPTEFDLEQIEAGGVQKRVIKISADSLFSGDPRYNIVISFFFQAEVGIRIISV